MMKRLLPWILVAFGCDGGSPRSMVANNHRPVGGPCQPTQPSAGGGDACLNDDDCGAGQLCSCAPDSFGWAHIPHNYCVPAGCRVDSDCGRASCSPTVSADCGPFYGVRGYFCHTEQDTCLNDSDCVQDGRPGFCARAPEADHWSCSFAFCAG
jgi:hypothetical protein